MNDNELLHTRYSDLFTDNEATDPALARLISDLETVYTSAKCPASLSRQFMSTLQTHRQHDEIAIVEQRPSSLAERLPRRRSHEGHRRRWQRGLSTLVAAVLMALIVSLLLSVLRQTHQPSRNGTGAAHLVDKLNRFMTIHMLNTRTGWAQISNARIGAFAVLRTTDGGSHWQDMTPPQMTTCVDDNPAKLYALDATTAWISDILPHHYPRPETYHGVLLRTNDAGRTWQTIAVPPAISDAFSIRDAHFLNAQVGWITIESRTRRRRDHIQHDLWQTSNGGQSWSNITNLDPSGGKGVITFIDEKTWWLTGVPASNGHLVISVTHDGGYSWHERVLPVPAGISFNTQELLGAERLQFFSARDGILAVRDRDIVVYVTHDGGETWQPTTPLRFQRANQDASYSPSLPVFADMKHGWVYEEVIPYAGMKLPTTNRLIITNDGGQHWMTIEVEMPGGEKGQTVSLDTVRSTWFNPSFVSAKVGWLMGYYSPSTSDLPHSELFTTVDGGHTWTVVDYRIS